MYGISNHFINYFQSWIHIQNIFFIFIVQTEHNNMKSPRLVVQCIKHLVCVDISVVNCHYLVMRVECSWEQQPKKWERMTTALKMEGYNRTSMLIRFIIMMNPWLKNNTSEIKNKYSWMIVRKEFAIIIFYYFRNMFSFS